MNSTVPTITVWPDQPLAFCEPATRYTPNERLAIRSRMFSTRRPRTLTTVGALPSIYLWTAFSLYAPAHAGAI